MFDYFDINLYKKVKIETATHILIKLCFEKEIIILILAFI
jgi:hypothetical protein